MPESDFRLFGTIPLAGIPHTAPPFSKKERLDKGRLRRCGLCGNEHVRLEKSPNGLWYVACDRYACNREVDRYYEEPDEAVYQWNTKSYILK